MTTLRDYLRDLIQDVKDNENEVEALKLDDEDIIDEYIEIICTRLIGQ